MIRNIAIGLLVLITAALAGGSWFFSSALIDAEFEAGADSTAALAEHDLPTDPDVFSVDSDGVRIEGWYFEGTEQCGLVFLHGYGGERSGMSSFLEDFSDTGCHMVAYDARGHGESGHTFHTFGAHEKHDGVAVVEWLEDHADLDTSEIGLFGISYGAATVLTMMPLVPDVAFVIADSPYASLRDVATFQAHEQYGAIVTPFINPALKISEMRADFDEDEAAPVRSVVGTSTPALLMHEKSDPYTPVENSRLIDEADPNDGIVYVEFDAGGGHATMHDDDPARYQALLDEFLAEYAPAFEG